MRVFRLRLERFSLLFFLPMPRMLGLLTVVGGMYVCPSLAQTTVQPGAPGTPGRTIEPEAVSAQKRPQYTEADVRFMQGMIPHHAQALEMTALVSARTENRNIHRIAQRIEVAQRDEIAWMQRWLKDRHKEMPDPGAHAHHHGGHATLMPGMLTPEQMAQLADATGVEFDRLFLSFMIQHHEGALIMVKDLLATPGAAQVPDVYRFASDVDVDQRAEIRRMQTVLTVLSTVIGQK